jgi:glutathione S-transferase
MRLHGVIASAFASRAILLARLKGFELPVESPRSIEALKSPEFLAMSPFGKIPALETSQGCLIESQAICEYLDESSAGDALMPTDAFERARTRQITLIVDNYAAPHWRAMMPHLNPAKRDPAVVEAAIAGLRSALARLEPSLGPGPFAIGTKLTLADCMLFPLINHFDNALREFYGVSDLLRDTPKLERWRQHLNAHPVVGPTGTEQAAAFNAFARAVFFR